MRRLGFVVAVTAVFTVGCVKDQPVQPPGSAGPAYLISDGANNNGNPDFFFLPPLVADPSSDPNFDVGQFNAALSPVVEVCTLSDPPVDCLMSGGNPVLVFGPATMALDLTNEQYTRSWDTKSPTLLDPTKFYRIQVRGAAGGTILGFLDVDPVDQGIKNLRTGVVVQFQDGRTLPIKVRIEKRAFCENVGTDCAAGTVGTAGGKVLADRAGVQFAPGVLPGDRVVIIEQVLLKEGERCLSNKADLLEYPPCYRFRTDPGPTPFNAPFATASICPDLSVFPNYTRFRELFQDDQENGLPDANADFLPCTLGTKNAFRGGWRGLLARLIDVVTPRPVFAATAVIDEGAGGVTPGFSRFVNAVRARIEAVSSTDQSTAVGSRLRVSVRVIATHPAPGELLPPHPLAGISVTFSASAGAVALPNPVPTNSDGIASVVWTLPLTPGTYTIGASATAMGSPVTFTATGVLGIRVSGFTSPRNPAPLLDPSGNASTALSGSSNIVSALGDVTKFGASGTVRCGVTFLPFVTSIAPGSLVDALGNRRVDVFFAGLTTTTLSSGEATELAAFLGAGGVLYLAGDTDNGDGPSYNPLFTALGVSDVYSDQILTSAQSSGQSSNPSATPVTTGLFGVVGPLEHTGFRIITTSSMSTVATGNSVTSTLVAEGAFGSGRIAAMGDPLYWNQFTVADADNQRYFLNLFALGCPAPVIP